MKSILYPAIAGLLLFVSLSAQAQDLALRRTAERFLRLAYDGRFAELAPLWTEGRERRAAFERRVRSMLGARCVYVEAVAITAAGPEDVLAEVVTTRGDAAPAETIPLRLRVVRGDGRWSIAAIDFPDEELAARVAAAGDDAREAIVRDDAPRITGTFVLALERRIRELIPSATGHARAPAAIAFARNLAAAIGDRRGEALLTADQAMIAFTDAKYADATRLSREALDLAEAVDDPNALARIWYVRGVALGIADQSDSNEEAVDAYRRAVSFAERADDPLLNVGPLQMLASISIMKGDTVTARRLLERMHDAVAGIGDVKAEIQYERLVGLIYVQQDDLTLALQHLQRALTLARQPRQNIYMALLTDIANIFIEQGKLDRAARMLAEVRSGTPEYGRLDPVVRQRSGLIAARRGRFDEAECLLREAAALWAWHGYHHGPVFDELARFLLPRKQYRDVIRLMLEQIPDAEEHNPYAAVRALAAAAEAYKELGDRTRSVALTDEAIALRERLDEQVSGTAQERARASETTSAVYELRGELALDGGDVAAALATIESGRGRALLQSSTSAAAEDRREEARYKQAVADLAAQIARAGDDRSRAALQERLEAARGDYQSFLDGLHDRSERRAAAVRPVDAAALTETVRRLPSAMTAIEYVVRERRLHIFVARKNHITHVSVAISRARLAARVEHLTSMISAGDLRYRAAARELFATLIAPVERQIGGAKVLCIVPDETLWRVPFAALVDERERFLVERFAVVYAPSLTVYREIASRSASLGGTPRVLAVAGSVRGAEREGHALCSIYGRHRCQLLARTAATEGRIKSELAQGTLVHFATHGVFDDRNPMNSRLLLRRGDDAEEDGSLEAWEIARLRLRADLVVLSGCDTARGRIGGGEGVIGMVWSFFVAGARSAVATQWAVETTSAADLMIDFHRVLHTGGAPLAKARALRAAQLRILHREGTRHPFYWAGFVLFGDAS
ncbi:MAG TPA: CHAT domain-containing protein [Thermoanaerobaculia bacterium]|jgi:CHAT domain-containing protein